MTDLGEVWLFTRFRLDQSIDGLTDAQLSWQPHPTGHSIAEYCFHIAGAEHYWSARIRAFDPASTELGAKLDRAIFAGFLRDGDPPFDRTEMRLDRVREVLDFAYQEVFPLFDHPTPEQLAVELTSPVGDHVTAKQGLFRLAQHAGYHTGQIWLTRQLPGFPE